MLTAEFIYTKSLSALSPATEVSFVNGQVKIPLAQVSDGDLHRFQAQENGTPIRFWLYQKPDGKIATVFDACQICGAVGFYKTANGVVCKNCAAPINPQSVGTPGGCNPIPLKASQTADAVIIQEADIAAGAACSRSSKMFVRLVYESFRRQKRRKLLAGAAITLGVTVATAMIAVATDIGDKINRELRTIGANLVVTPQEDTLDVEIGGVNLKPPSDGAFLNEADLPKIKGTFWHNNITGFAPMLPVNVTLERDGKTEDVTLLGTYFAKQISFGKEEFTTGVRTTHPWWRVSGAWPDDTSRDVLLGERLAARLPAKAGDTVTLSGRELQVSGILSTGGN